MYVSENGVSQKSSVFFHTPSKLAAMIFFYLKNAGHFFCTSKNHVKRKYDDSFLLMYVKGGNGSVCYDDKVYQVKRNDVFLIDCRKPYSYTSDNWEIFWIHFDGNTSSDIFNVLYDRNGCVFSLKESIIVPKYLNYIIDSFIGDKTLNEPIVSCYIQRILTELMLNFSDANSEDNLNRADLVADTITYIENNYRNKISIQKLSLNVNLSPFYFSRMFKKETGYSPYEYIIKARLNEAKKLLKCTELPIKEIAFSSGFNSESNFISCFKNNNNVTPKEFRNASC